MEILYTCQNSNRTGVGSHRRGFNSCRRTYSWWIIFLHCSRLEFRHVYNISTRYYAVLNNYWICCIVVYITNNECLWVQWQKLELKDGIFHSTRRQAGATESSIFHRMKILHEWTHYFFVLYNTNESNLMLSKFKILRWLPRIFKYWLLWNLDMYFWTIITHVCMSDVCSR